MSHPTLSQFTVFGRNGQLVLSLNSEILLPENAPVRLTRLQLEELDYSKLYAAYSSGGRKSKVDPSVLFQVIAYAYQCGIYSSRKIEEACRYRVDFLWLPDDRKAPGVMTIQNFIHNDLTRSLDAIFTEINAYIFAKERVDTNHTYIDGTKLRANAGNYTWVWKKSCIKNRNNVFAKISELLVRVNEVVCSIQGAEFETFREYSVERVGYIRDEFARITGLNVTDFVHSKGKHKSELQRIYEELTGFHTEVLNNLNSIHGAYLRMNRSIQAEGTFGSVKWNRGYNRLRRRSTKGVILELGLISCGFNLHKYHLKTLAAAKAA